MRKVILVSLALLLPAALCSAQDSIVDEAEPLSWTRVDFLYWWLQNGPTPPLATTGHFGDPSPGGLGQPRTDVLFADDGLEYVASFGGRLTYGSWFAADSPWGWEVSGFMLTTNHLNFFESSDAAGEPELYVPLIIRDPDDPNFGNEGGFIIAEPINGIRGGFRGELAIASETQLWGAEANGLMKLYRSGQINADVLFGFRYLGLEEDLSLSGVQDDFIADIQNEFSEQFATRNRFFGLQLGGNVSLPLSDRLDLDVQAKVAVGVSSGTVDINGSSTFSGSGFGPTQTFPGAVLTQPTNIGRQHSDRLAVAPQVQLKLAYDVTARLRTIVAYDVLYWSSVVRPGNQIDRHVNLSQVAGNSVTGAAVPRPQFDTCGFIAQGLSAGLEFRY